jgi:SAM-dependent methyltransferase
VDAWASGGSYESFMARWSRLVARAFLPGLAVPGDRRWLDVGSGTGALTQAVLELCSPNEVLGIDPSPAFVQYATEHLPDERAAFCVGDAQRLPLADASVDVVVSGLVLNFLPDLAAALAEIRRVTTDGGVVAAYVWDYVDGMQMLSLFWDVAVGLDPAAAHLHEGARFRTCTPDRLVALIAGAGLTDVVAGDVTVPTSFADFDDFWSPFLGGQGPAPAYVASLGEAAAADLREALRARLVAGPSGSITLAARAWTVQAVVA